MTRTKKTVSVFGVDYVVIERAGYLKADMRGIGGWTSIWGDSYPDLIRRIKRGLGDGQ